MTSTRRRTAYLLGLLACAAALWVWWGGAGPEKAIAIEGSRDEESVVSQPVDALQADAAEAPGSDTQPERRDQGTARTEVAEDRRARISGRCVTVEGQPIRDCTISVWTYQTREQEAKFPDQRRQKIPRLQSGEDGRFEARFLPSKARSYRLAFFKKGQASHSGKLGEVRPAETRDLGDIVLLTGARVRGRVLDDRGRPVAACRVSVSAGERLSAALDKSNAAFPPLRTKGATTNGTGRFDLYRSLCSGRWKLLVSRELVSPGEIVIPDNQSEVDLVIRVRGHDDKDLIQGHVLDQQGQPVPDARLSYLPRPTNGPTASDHYSLRDGSFQIPRSEWDTGVPVHLRIDKSGFNPLKTAKPYDWGTSGLRLVLTRGTSLSIHVVDAETRSPIENYAVRIRDLGSGPTTMGPQERGAHKNGILRIPGMAWGRYRIVVEPDESHAASRWRTIDVGRVEGPPILFELHKLVRQQLRVVTAKGDPVMGSKVELLEPEEGHPIDANTFVGGIGRSTTSKNQGRPWTQGKTNDKGILELSGPPLRDLGLRITGPTHVPLFVNGIRLQNGSKPFVVQVVTGASLSGRIRPTAVLRQLTDLDKRESKASPASTSSKRPGLRLLQKAPPNRYPPGGSKRFPIAEDGTFKIAGIAPGSWTLQLVWDRKEGVYSYFQWLDLQELADLRKGEERELDLDISRFLLGDVEGSVTCNDSPAKKWTLHLRARKHSLPMGITRRLPVTLPLDEVGKFATQLIPGIYDCSLSPEYKNGPWRPLYPTGSTIRVTAGGRQKVRLKLGTVELRLHFENHDGKPLPKLRAILVDEASGRRYSLPISDSDGNCSARAPTGSFRLVTLPKHMTTLEGYEAFINAHRRDYETAFNKAHILLGELTIEAGGQAEPREITVPKSAGY